MTLWPRLPAPLRTSLVRFAARIAAAEHRRQDQDHNDMPCRDCGMPTFPRHGEYEFYMVRDDLWAAAGMERMGGYLCVGCLERRLGHRLRRADFQLSEMNEITVRLASRLADQS